MSDINTKIKSILKLPRIPGGASKYYRFAAYAVIIILINLISASSNLFLRLDLTANASYSLSRASKKTIKTLVDPLTIRIFFTENLPAPHNTTERYLRDLMSEYAIHARGGRFNYVFYNVSPKEGDTNQKAKTNREMAKNYGIYPVQIQKFEQDEVKFQKAFMGMVLIHGDMIETVPSITSTEGLEYKITSIINKMNQKISAFQSIDGKIKVKLYYSSSWGTIGPLINLPKAADAPNMVKTVTDKLNARHYGKLEYVFIDPSQDPKIEKDIAELGLTVVKWPAIKARNLQAGQAYSGIVLEYKDRRQNAPVIQQEQIPIFGTRYTMLDEEAIEKVLSAQLEAMIDIHSEIGYLTGHGELPLRKPYMPQGMPQMQQSPETAANFNSELSESYTVKEVSLKDGIPAGIDCLIIAGPKQRFSEYELFLIDQFLMKGKSLAVFSEAFNEVRMQQQQQMMGGGGPQYIPVHTGLEELLTHYGASVKSVYVLDDNCYKNPEMAKMQGGEGKVHNIPMIGQETISADREFMENINQLIVMNISPIELDAARLKDNKIKSTVLFSSSKESWETEGRINLHPMFLRKPTEKDKFKSYPLAAILEGKFKSYFADKAIPVKEEASQNDKDKKTAGKQSDSGIAAKIKAEGTIIKNGKPGRIFLTGTSTVLKDQLFSTDERARILKPNTIFIMNVIDYLNGRTDYAVMRGKTPGFNPLKKVDAVWRTFVKVFNTVAPPLFVVVAGLFVLFWRISRKRKIERIFSGSPQPKDAEKV